MESEEFSVWFDNSEVEPEDSDFESDEEQVAPPFLPFITISELCGVVALLLKWFILLVLWTGVERALKAGFGWDHVKEIDCVRGGPRRLCLLGWK